MTVTAIAISNTVGQIVETNGVLTLGFDLSVVFINRFN
jgi:hypothetical protein